MMINMIMFICMVKISVILGMMSMIYMYLDLSIMLEWKVVSINSMNIEFMMLLDWVSLLFMSFILMISGMIMVYSVIYMKGEENLNRFNSLVTLFIFSMIFMVISPNVVSILIGWDGLGLVSYCLVMYYQNFSSYNSAMVTVLCNRLGDVGILMSISLMMMMGSWSLEILDSNKMVMVMLLLASITKSAQIPFSVWLPLAMAAPTPVSALVHSSTLVTAGVYLIIRFFNIFSDSVGGNSVLFNIAIFTMFMAGMAANFEYDFKKIIALSTLSQLGFMMMILSSGFKLIAMYHLLIHAIFKSLLFMSAGVIIHSMKNIQDIRLLGNLNEIMPFTMMSFMISSIALTGTPFMSGFYSKDLIMELVYSKNEVNIYMEMLVIMSLFLTVLYSVRLLYYLMYNKSMKFYSYYYFSEEKLMNFSMMILLVFSVMMGALMNWVFFFDFYMVYLSMKVKLITLGMYLLGGIVGIIMVINIKKYLKLYYLGYFVSSMWFLSMLYTWIYHPFNKLSSEIDKVDKSWIEKLEKYYLMNFMLSKYKMINFKYYMFMNTFMLMIMFVNMCY